MKIVKFSFWTYHLKITVPRDSKWRGFKSQGCLYSFFGIDIDNMKLFLSTTLEWKDFVKFAFRCTFSDTVGGISIADSLRPSSSSTGCAHTMISPLTETSVQFRGLRSQPKKQPVRWRNNLCLVARMDTQHRETGRGVPPLGWFRDRPRSLDKGQRASGRGSGAAMTRVYQDSRLQSTRAIADRRDCWQE